MRRKRKIEMIARRVSFAEGEDMDLEYYAGLDWKESAKNVEEMRKMFWDKQYKKGMIKVISKGKLNDDRDDIE
jgi:hypothetical protein